MPIESADWTDDHWDDSDWHDDDWDENAELAGSERLSRKKHKPRGKRRVSDLRAASTTDKTEQADPLISSLLNSGHIDEVLSELKSGKEATAYLARSGQQDVLLKIYRDLAARSFKNDQIYREGRKTLDRRIQRAIDNRSRKGINMLQADWVLSEYYYLWQLWKAGLPVPKPLVGPQMAHCVETVPAVLMELVGSSDQIAPRLSDVSLTPQQAQEAWQQAVQGMSELLRLGYVHGDYSAYNLLWWENTVIIIDVPQLSTRQNPQFHTLLERDTASLSQSFRRHDIRVSAQETLSAVRQGLERPAPTPRLVLP